MPKQDDGLFLLEVLIDKIVFVKSPCFSDKEFRTCVNIDCPAVEPLEICDDDPGSCTAKSGGPFVKTFNTGKSCLFSLKESDISKAMNKFPIKISVYKSLPCGCLPSKIVMGEATIDMTKEFVEARKNFLADPNTVSYQALKDSFRIVGPDGAETGEIVMFLRISCFGKLIITRFQGGGPPTLGTGGGANTYVDRSCNPPKQFQSTQDPCACGVAKGAAFSAGHGLQDEMSGGKGGLGYPAQHPVIVCHSSTIVQNSMPCTVPQSAPQGASQDPATKQQMSCRNTDQYCLHVPKGELPNLPFTQEITEEQKLAIMSTYKQKDQKNMSDFVTELEEYYDRRHDITEILNIHLKESIDRIHSPFTLCMAKENYSYISLGTIRSKRRSVSFSDTVDYESSRLSHTSSSSKRPLFQSNDLFGKQETAVFMTLLDELSYNHTLRALTTAATQATASINKCLQAPCENHANKVESALNSDSRFYSSCTMSTIPIHNNKKFDSLRYSDVYFFGRKKDQQKSDKLGMGKKGKSTGQTHTMPVKIESKTAQTKKVTAASTGTSTKTVSIKDEKNAGCCRTPCPAIGQSMKGEMVATVSHIKLGPKEACPVHGKDPCQGPKCIVALSGEQQAPVKVTTMTNPRRGVFELVIRRINGAPLAKNELMLEWTPPPSNPSTCGTPCGFTCAPAVCIPSTKSCKSKVCRKPCGPPCRSVPCSFCCKKPCGKPCRSCKPCKPSKPCKPCRPCRPCPPPRPGPCSPCRPCKPCRPCPPPRKIFKRPCPPCSKPCCPPSPCSRCGGSPPCGPPCRQCKPRPPSPCKPCRRCTLCSPTPCRNSCVPPACAPFPPITFSPPSRCRSPCRPLCCKSPCSSPCLRPCPMGRKKARRCKSQPRIRCHRKRISPCHNRSKFCPVVRCRSVPGPCIGCCGILPCPPRKCCSILPCKPPRCCKSSCSTCCA